MGAARASLVLPAPAKLNLFLHVTGRREDGYHTLQSVFQLLDHGDTITLGIRDDGRIERTSELPGVPAKVDLVVRAARLLAEAAARGGADSPAGVDIHIDKRLPMGGGLGGGSSNAATVLVGLNRLWGLGRSVDDLAAIGLGLGADVPVFVRGTSAWAEGVGERLTPIDLPERWFLVLDPKVAVPTAAVFQAPELTRDSKPVTLARFVAGEPVRNDLEPVVRARYAAVGRALDWLGRYATARMTGSGACVFASFDDEERAREVATRVPSEFGHFVARGVNRSPLLDAMG